MKEFKAKGRNIASLYRKTIRTEQPKCSDLSVFRGFEDLTIRRQKQKLIANQCVLYAQKQGMNASKIATVYEKANSWSVDVAFIQALKDFFDIYRPKTTTMPEIPLQPVHQMIPPPMFPFAIECGKALRKKKRHLEPTSSSLQTKDVSVMNEKQSFRRVRRRLSS